ncbi:MAG: nuclear transport factor 2 family protein [Alphaproteobacteria bacterium]|nr:nuclear transport factor 2 family protein [Alphaproteobacteria bacterium]
MMKAMDKAAADVTDELMTNIMDAFNRHDVEAIVGFFAEDGVFQTARGTNHFGERLVGKQQIRNFLTKRFKAIPDMQWLDDKNWFVGNRAVSEWRVVATAPTGERIEALGCDIYEFAKGKIKVKDTYWKSREKLQ